MKTLNSNVSRLTRIIDALVWEAHKKVRTGGMLFLFTLVAPLSAECSPMQPLTGKSAVGSPGGTHPLVANGDTLHFVWMLAAEAISHRQRDLTSVPQAGDLTNRVSAIRVPGVSKVVKAQRGADGAIHLLFDTADGPQYVKSQDSGLTFSAPIPVVDAAVRKPGLAFHGEDLAVGKDGRVLVAMSNNAWKLKLPEEEWGLYYTRLERGANAFAPVRNLNLKPSEGFSLAANNHGEVTACFLSDKLFAKVSRDNGETFTANAELNPAWDPCNCCTTSAAYGPDGKLAVLYREETNNERDMYVVLWDQSRGTKPSRTRISGTGWKVDACPMTYFTIEPTDTGYLTAWPTKGQVYFARLDQEGAVLPPGEIRTPGTSGMRTGLLALSATDGATLIAWKNKDVLRWQIYDAKGQPQGQPGSATSPGHGAAGVVLPNGKFVLFP